MSDDPKRLTTYLDRIAERSRSGEIPWVRIAMTVLGARRQTASGEKLLTIQQAQTTRISYEEPFGDDAVEVDYVFQVSSAVDKKIELSLNSRTRPDLRDPLARLYEAAGSSANLETGRILSELAEA